MTRARMDGLYLFLLGSAVFLLLGAFMEHSAAVTTVDFKIMYYSGRCLLQNCDPYRESSLREIYRMEGGKSTADTASIRRVEYSYMYLPTAFAVTAPFALMPFGPAHIVWLTVSAAAFLLAAFLIWNQGAEHSPLASGGLVFLLLANSQTLLLFGNPAGIAISLCVIAVWCFLNNRWITAGIVCLAVSLALKPHDAGLVWLFFVIAAPIQRRRAWLTFAVTIAISLPAVLWVSHVSPHWFQELQSNMASLSAHGDLNDPGPSTSGARGLSMMVNLQTVTSLFVSDPQAYNAAAYFAGGFLILAWIVVVFRSRLESATTWLALSAISALSMLPIYHRQYDLRLLLLAVPSCAMLWSAKVLSGRLAFVATSITFVLTGDLFWIVFDHMLPKLMPRGAPGIVVTFVLVLMVPFLLLLIGCGNLYLLAKRMRRFSWMSHDHS